MTNKLEKRKICVVVASRANYGRVKYLLRAIEEHPKLELQLIVGASTLLDRFGKAVDVIKNDGFMPMRAIHYVVEGETLGTQAKSTGLGIVELSTAFDDIKPDAVLTVADRFETMATAIASTYMNIPLIHLQGGELSGNIDDRVRHSITKLADYHFTCSEESRNRVISMGEEVGRVFNLGCPAMDVLKNTDLRISNDLMSNYHGSGDDFDWEKPYLLLVQHPVTTSYGKGVDQIKVSLEALSAFDSFQKLVLWPNIDAGSDSIAKGIRMFREHDKPSGFRFFKNFSPEDYCRVLFNCSVCIGNSSSFIREGAFIGKPAVIIGDRQANREHGENVIFCGYNLGEIKSAIKSQITNKNFDPNFMFGDGNSGSKIAEEISFINLSHSKINTF